MEETPVNGAPELFDNMLRFVLDNNSPLQSLQRLGKLLTRGQSPILTPHYMATTSRGIVPHLTQDTLQKHTNVNAVYFGLEDFIEKSRHDAPIYKTPTHDRDQEQSALKTYTSLPDRCLSILGPRRVPRIACPSQNTNSAISISTSVGFGSLSTEDYVNATKRLKPDVATSLVDLVTTDKISIKRIERSADRTHAWLRDHIADFEAISQKENGIDKSPLLFASIPPLEAHQQSFFLSDLADEFKPSINGVCLYSPDTTLAIPEPVQHVPRICIDDPPTPHAILRAVSLGVDLVTLPLITWASEQGLAFTFSFPSSLQSQSQLNNQLPLATNLWSPIHSTSLNPLVPSCKCYTCTRHHAAYIHHLLSAKEMLGWTLLQIHNFSIIDSFFASIRASIAQGTFEEDVKTFEQTYTTDFPEAVEGGNKGPRVRGYQMKSVGPFAGGRSGGGHGEGKKNEKVWGRLEERLGLGSSGDTTPGTDPVSGAVINDGKADIEGDPETKSKEENADAGIEAVTETKEDVPPQETLPGHGEVKEIEEHGLGHPESEPSQNQK